MQDYTRRLYYQFKPFIPRRIQIFVRRKLVQLKLPLCTNVWPIDERTAIPPEGWSGWPDKKQFALILTHDVDTVKGQRNCKNLIKLEEQFGFKSSFNFVPERYNVLPELRHYLTKKGCEVGVHGLYHDGKYYQSRKTFQERAMRINHYLKKWQSVGYRSPSMLHNLGWIFDLNVEYDASTFDTDPFEPQPEGKGTIFPFFVRGKSPQKGYVELPYTLPQDFTLFILMKESSINIWKQKLDWIVENGGMALLITHPDYMIFEKKKPGFEEYPARYYEELLEYIKLKYEGSYWHVLPKDISRFWVKKFVADS